MKLDRNQWIFIAVFLVFFGLIYFGLDTKPSEHSLVEKSRAENFEKTDVSVLIKDALENIDPGSSSKLKAMEYAMRQAPDSVAMNMEQEKIAGMWFQLGYPEISGYYAEEIAHVRQSVDAWSIAGTTYALALKKDKSEETKDYCAQKAVKCFEMAESLDSTNVDLKINKALVYTDRPLKDNPMKGILDLVALNQSYPNNVNVLVQLGRLSIQTGQFDKAKQRLEQAYDLASDNQTAICLLVSVYEELGETIKAVELSKKCNLIKK